MRKKETTGVLSVIHRMGQIKKTPKQHSAPSQQQPPQCNYHHPPSQDDLMSRNKGKSHESHSGMSKIKANVQGATEQQKESAPGPNRTGSSVKHSVSRVVARTAWRLLNRLTNLYWWYNSWWQQQNKIRGVQRIALALLSTKTMIQVSPPAQQRTKWKTWEWPSQS